MQKQGLNGKQGEVRTEQILCKYFIVNIMTNTDFDGTDFFVQLIPENDKFGNYDKIEVKARVQAKFFENNNEVKIAKEYVEDIDGLRTDFFALLHTDIEEEEVCFFFTSKDIIDHFKYRIDNNKGYYIFSLSKQRQFIEFRNFSKNEINHKIEEGIRRTEEYSNQKYIQEIENKYTNPVKTFFESNNCNLFKEIANKHIVDKLHIALTSYSDFRRVTAWRLINKISFKDIKRTTTFYHQFHLHTDNDSILSFFKNLEISNEVIIKNPKIFQGVKAPLKKSNEIIEILNNNLIFWLSDRSGDNVIKISKERKSYCSCLDCQISRFEYQYVNQAISLNNNLSDNLWDSLQKANILTRLGYYDKAKEILSKVSQKAKKEKEEVIYFIAKYNIRSIAFKTWENEYPDVEKELQTLSLNEEKKHILRIVANNSLINAYTKSIKDICFKIKDYSQRYVVNNTLNLTFELKAKLLEYQNFIEGNWFIVSDDFNKIIEEAIESCIISFSMQTEHSEHLKCFDDYWVELAIHNCEPYKLLSFFQRNEVETISYKSERDYFEHVLSSFFDKRNIDFLSREIKYIDNKTKNHYLRRKVESYFGNICILLAYLEFDKIPKDFIKQVNYFIKKLDFDIHQLSLLAHPFFKKPDLFETKNLLDLLKLLLSNDKYSKGYLITNILLVLKEKGFIIKPTQKMITERLTQFSINESRYNFLSVLPDVLAKKQKELFLQKIKDSLEEKFNTDLFYDAILNDCIEKPKGLFDFYLSFYKNILDYKDEAIGIYRGSAYTGISERANSSIRNIIVLYIKINDTEFLKHPFLTALMQVHPYYNFILNIDKFKKTDNFDINWILENQNRVILNKLATNKYISELIKLKLKEKYDKKIAKIYLTYF